MAKGDFSVDKLTIIGNAGTGKTTLSRRLAVLYGLPLIHVDSIQFVPNMKIRRHAESIAVLNEIMSQDKWLIDGYGPLDILEKRFALADKIVLIDLPLWRSYWWCSKRQIKSLWKKRSELPEGCNEASLEHTVKLYKTLWQVHTKMRPELLRILSRDNCKNKVLYIRNMAEWDSLFEKGL